MNKDVYGILGDLTAEILLEIIAECMDDYLYVIDLQNNKMEISQSALDRFMISETHVRNVKQAIMSVVYEEDRTMFAKHMQAVMDGKEKVHDIHYRWLDKNGLPVWEYTAKYTMRLRGVGLCCMARPRYCATRSCATMASQQSRDNLSTHVAAACSGFLYFRATIR